MIIATIGKKIVSHNANSIASIPVHKARDIAIMVKTEKVDVVGIDEAQFFDMELPEICDRLALEGARVIIAGLDMDYAGKPFGPMPNLLAMSEFVTKLHAICMRCGNLATHSYRKTQLTEQVSIGGKGSLRTPMPQLLSHTVPESV